MSVLKRFLYVVLISVFIFHIILSYGVYASPMDGLGYAWYIWGDDVIGFGMFDPHYSPPTYKSGVFRVYVIFLDFSNYEHVTSISEVLVKVYDVDRYFREVSYGAIELNISYLSWWIVLNNTREYYGADSGDRKDVNKDEFIYDSLSAADPYIDYREVDFVFLVHAGDDQAYSKDPDDLWSSATLEKEYFNYDGGVSLGIMIVAENDPYGAFAHELGHNLGLPDLYNYFSGEDYVGVWSLMARGSWLEPPASIMSPEKVWLGWINSSQNIVVERGDMLNITLSPLELEGRYLSAMIPRGDVYFMVEYRRKIYTDASLPSEGILISFINESLYSGQGIIRVIDADPSTSSLNDAAFQGGMIYVDYDYEVLIHVFHLNESGALVLVKNGLPDLYIESISNYTYDGMIRYIVSIGNGGSGPSEPFKVSMFVNESLYDVVYIDEFLYPGESVDVRFKDVSLGGNYTLMFFIDSDGKVIESNESNNVFERSFRGALYALDKYIVSDDRVDVGTLQSVKMHFTYYNNASSYAGKPVIINDTLYITDSNGWVNLTVSLSHVGRLTWVVTDENGIQLAKPSIIWDRVKIILKPLDTRIDVNSSVSIRWEAYYEYNGSDAKPYIDITLNDTLFKDMVGAWWITVESINDTRYGLTLFEANKVKIIWDKLIIIDGGASSNRLDVGSKVSIWFKIIYAYDGKVFNNGSIYINTFRAKYDPINKWWYINYTMPYTGAIEFGLKRIVDYRYGLTLIEDRVGGILVVWDKILITNMVTDHNLYEVGEEAIIWIDAVYAYDENPFTGDDGIIFINGFPAMWSEEDGRWMFGVSSSIPANILYKVTEVLDNRYGLTRFDGYRRRYVKWVYLKFLYILPIFGDVVNLLDKLVPGYGGVIFLIILLCIVLLPIGRVFLFSKRGR